MINLKGPHQREILNEGKLENFKPEHTLLMLNFLSNQGV